MALLQMNLMSESLMRPVPVHVLLPIDKLAAPGVPGPSDRPLKTLYLLNGVFGCSQDWIVGSSIKCYADANDLAVVMPGGENMFYVDQPETNSYYGQFVGDELVELTRRAFRLSREREDTFIAGLSMGGYGALRNGLKYHKNFGSVAGLSSALMGKDYGTTNDESLLFFRRKTFVDAVFGGAERLHGTDLDPYWLAEELVKSGEELPRLFLACGVDDPLLPESQAYRDHLARLGVSVTYMEGPGAHEWGFWDRAVQDVIDWLPLSGTGEGVNSGNVL